MNQYNLAIEKHETTLCTHTDYLYTSKVKGI